MREDRDVDRELVQVSAVGMAALLDARQGHTQIGSESVYVNQLVILERFRQEGKWGTQHHSDLGWSIILLEEVCEYLTEVWAVTLGGGKALVDLDDETRRGLLLISDVAQFEGVAREWCESALGGGS